MEPDPVTTLKDFMTRRQSERDNQLAAFNTWSAGFNRSHSRVFDIRGKQPRGSGQPVTTADARHRGGDGYHLIQTSAQPARPERSGRGPQPQAGVRGQVRYPALKNPHQAGFFVVCFTGAIKAG